MDDASVEKRKAAEAQLASAEAFRAADQLDDAVEVLERALATSALEPALVAEIRLRLADCHRERNEHEESLEAVRPLIADPPDKVWLARAQVRAARAVFFQGNHTDTIESCMAAISALGPTDLHMDYALAQLWLGHALRVTGLSDRARRAFTDGMAASKRADSNHLESGCLASLGPLEIRRGNLEYALWCLDEAVRVAREAGHRPDLAKSLLHRAVCLLHRGEHDAARRNAIQAEQLYAALQDRRGQALTHLLLARLHRRAGADSVPSLKDARRHARASDYDRVLLQIQEEQARLDLAKGRYEEAIELFRGIAGYDSGTHFDVAYDCLEGAARAELSLGRTDQAEHDARTALEYAEVAKDTLSIARCLTTLAEITGDPEPAERAAKIQMRSGAAYDLSRTEAVLLGISTLQKPPDTHRPSALSPAMRDTLREAETLRDFVDPVLILGEPSVGKAEVARLIAIEARAELLTIECQGQTTAGFRAALSRVVQAARADSDQHVIFLDRVDRLSPESQDLLVRTLSDDGPVRIIASAVPGPAARTGGGAGGIGTDLLYRLSSYTLTVPPYRERPEDLLALAEHHAGGRLAPEVIKALLTHAWPGNALEISNVLAEARHRAGKRPLTAAALPQRIRATPEPRTLPEKIEDLERREISLALAEADGNRTRASLALGVSRKGLIDRMKRLGIWDGKNGNAGGKNGS